MTFATFLEKKFAQKYYFATFFVKNTLPFNFLI